MTRWHTATCVSPDVVLSGDLPICNTCGAVPDLDAIKLKQQETSPLPKLPPNEPPGQFNLYWPISSLYSHSKTRQGPDGDNQNEKRVSTDDFEPSLIYHRRLKDHEFRLLRLEAAPSGTDLLHVHLETHDQERFPVYETVSYTWGGENNDNSRCRPVFIGPHWDVLLQTQNCWDMLKFLQPADGLRRLWVDAICINQKDDKEREEQVSKMVDIYQEAQRVVVYLGSSLIDLASPHEYPIRRKFEHSIMQSNDGDHLVKDGKLNLNKLLDGRYFSRLWVIQELVISRQVVFQVGDTEFWADAATVPQLKGHDWENTPAPWLIHTARGTPPGIEMYEAMRATWSSKASDPRDKIFGVLALLNSHQGKELFRPDYSLSFLHVFIGVLAHSLLDQKHIEILCHAPCRSAPERQPSWMMDWNIPKWPAPCDFQDQAELAFESWKTLWPRDDVTPAQQNLSSVPSGFQTPTTVRLITSQFSTKHKHNPDLRDLPLGLRPRLRTTRPRSRPASPRPRLSELGDLDDEEVQVLKEESWDKGATVDASTGSLTINLTRICEFAVMPSKVHTHEGMMIFQVQGAARTKARMYLITDRSLDHLVTPSSDHLFLLDQGDEKSFVLLILRKLDDGPVFRLIGCCYGLYFRYFATSKRIPRRHDKLFLPELRQRHRLNDIMWFIPGWAWVKDLPHLQPNNSHGRQLNTHVHEPPGGSTLFSLQAYCDCIHPRFHPVVNGEHVEMTMHPANWHSLLGCTSIPDFIELFAELRLEGENDWTSSKRILHRPLASLDHEVVDELESSVRYNRPLHLRTSRDKLLALMEDSLLHEDLAGIRSRSRSDACFYMPPETIVGEEAGMFTFPVWPESVLEGFTIDGRMYRVCIA